MRGRRCAGGLGGNDPVADPGRVRRAEHVRDAPRHSRAEHPRRVHERFGLLRDQRRRHRFVRRGSLVAGRGKARACAAHAQGRDGVGELRLRLRDRSARGSRRRRHHPGLGLRGVVAGALAVVPVPARQGMSPPACWRLSAGGIHATVARAGPDGSVQTTAATPHPRMWPGCVGKAGAAAPARSGANGSFRTRFDRHFSRDPCGHPHVCRTPSRTNASWTRSRRRSRRTRWRTVSVT